MKKLPPLPEDQHWSVVNLRLTAQSYEEMVEAINRLKETHGGLLDMIVPSKTNSDGEWEALGGVWVATKVKKQSENIW